MYFFVSIVPTKTVPESQSVGCFWTYYRCTSESCGVKKITERSLEDLSILITTYEGTHTHPCPITHPQIMPQTATFGGRSAGSASSLLVPPLNYPLNFNLTNNNTTTTTTSTSTTAFPSYDFQEGRYCSSPLPSYEHRDNGLLQDIIKPFLVSKEES
ncbi:putative transcription factor WRKY family [Helianthus annuus]|nr:putative transcription factor WRKY family [Helianthus annuus]